MRYEDKIFSYAGDDGFVHDYSAEMLRSNWFRVPTREKEHTKLSLSIGACVKFDHIVSRTGYYVQPKDMPYDEMTEAAWKMLRSHITPKSENQLWNDGPVSDHNLTEADLKAVFEATGLGEKSFFRHIFWEVRRVWWQEQKQLLKGTDVPVDLRTLWYLDIGFQAFYPKEEWHLYSGKIIGTKAVWIGTYYPPKSFGGSWEEPPEYEAGGLADAVYQQLYIVENHYGTKFLVHPLDAQEIGNA